MPNPLMLKNFIDTLKMTQSFIRIFYEKISNQIFYFFTQWDFTWKTYLRVANMIFCFIIWKIRVVKRRASDKNFVQKSTHTVQINIEWIRFFRNYFWGHIFYTSAIWIGFSSDLFGQSKISKFCIPSWVNKNILWFDISKHNISVMKIFNC